MCFNFFLLLFSAIPSITISSDWTSTAGEHELLKDHYIVAVGSISEEEDYNYATYETTEWLEFNSQMKNLLAVNPVMLNR